MSASQENLMAVRDATSAPPSHPVRILVADDEYLVALDIVAQLGDCGYTSVGPASSGREAVRIARATRPDLALLDVRMPDGDGVTAARIIHQEMGIPVIMLSAYTDEKTIESAKDAGVYAYLAKPSTPHQLRAAVEVAWGRHLRMLAESDNAAEANRRLEERKLIERAKWILVQRTGVHEGGAMRLLEEHARQKGERLATVAQRVINHGESALRLSGTEGPPEGPGSEA